MQCLKILGLGLLLHSHTLIRLSIRHKILARLQIHNRSSIHTLLLLLHRRIQCTTQIPSEVTRRSFVIIFAAHSSALDAAEDGVETRGHETGV
ncbi:hypothetical protein BJ875DRAFT_451240 [Amylocarpus encephaloides]|uniref:Uncharacterized protein n=1 Tax=Amylocarpus encephaloides TaxID=45428 RepID=A0A9P7YSV0_9HELO|nr:hypothetical protein BJ875DRAFT_451240 [Amylocarpus encephaloides]